MLKYKVAIVGGGASGIVAAIECSKRFNGGVCLLERADRIGKKLIMTGNGRGNLTNVDLDLTHYHGDKNVPKLALEKFNAKTLENYFNNLGVMLTVEDGKVFPMSFQASSVLDMLMAKLNSLNTDIKCGYNVQNIVYKDGEYIISNDVGERVVAENVILAVGGKSGGHYGTDGSGYALAQAFGHTLTKTYPALVQLKCNLKDYGNLRGIKVKAKATAVIGGNAVRSAFGDLLFTDYGVSGNAIFTISGEFVKSGGVLSIDFLPDVTESQLMDFLIKKTKNCNYLAGSDLLTGIVHKQVGKVIIKSTDGKLANIVKKVKCFDLKITGDNGFDNSQVTKGGIRADEIDANTFESRLQKGLYLTGEVLDVDGDCGGYNLHFAFASGYIAGRSVK